MVSASAFEAQAAPVQRIWAIEGLRAWLAWAVVLAHVIQLAGLDRTVQGLWVTQFLATEAVNIFIIISGFVITSVVIQRQESWRRYIVRRIFRIFPVYLLLLPIGALTMMLIVPTLDHMSWASDPRFRYDDTARSTLESVSAAPLAHWIPHIFLFQGAIPDSALPFSQTSFLGPAWSLSLEWQFYLIAPALIWMLRKRFSSIVAVSAIALLAVLSRLDVFGHFNLPSFFPAIGYLFLVGIASRLVFEDLRRTRVYAVAVAIGCLASAALIQPIFAIALWLAFLCLLMISDHAQGRIERMAVQIWRAAFCSKPSIALGARSYAVYLVHWPVVQAAAFFLLPLGAFSQWEAFALVGAATFVSTLLLSEVLHVFVERPMIRLGATLAARAPGRERSDQASAATQ
ncbi:MAG: acyltransferase [Phycisphaerales bacterium]|nr:acyltransferase [Hyphomonadaceae bacterium]